jgi:rubrerythrin
MNEQINKALSTAIKAEESGINFFSKSARRLHRYQDLKLQFETFAKSKVANKLFFNELLALSQNQSLKVSGAFIYEIDLPSLNKVIENTEVVGDHSLPEEILKSAFSYLRETSKLYISLKVISPYKEDFEKMIVDCRAMFELVKKHIHLFSEEIRFYGYE